MAIQIHIEGYDSLEQVAVGGMAAVYKARRVSIDKTVAIKVLFPYLAHDESFIERFQREAKSAAKVQHENIVNVIDFGESGGCYYIVMEFYEGVTIADLLKEQTRVPLDVAASIILDVCFGLEAAHNAGIVHRDIKPANVIYTTQGGIKIADFGLAKKSGTMTVVTQPGKVLGTPAYMSPEQAAGEDVGPQSDIFSLGVVAFEMFCSKRPFEGQSYSEVLDKIQTQDPPPLSNENPLIQPDFETIVGRMLEKDQGRRYESVSDVIVDLEKAMEKFDIKRDRRRLRKYMADPTAYAEAFKEKMLARCLSQGTFFMQKGKSHITDAVREFKRILYLDPTNERARAYLARLIDEAPGEDATVELNKEVGEKKRAGTGRSGKTASETSSDRRSGAASARRPVGNRRSLRSAIAAPLVVLVVLGAAAAAWFGWISIGASTAGGNSAPTVSSPSRLTVPEGEAVEFRLSVFDADDDEVRVSADALPAGAVLTPDGDFRWQVGYDQAGAYELRFRADDGVHEGTSKTRIEVVDRVLELDFEAPRTVSTMVGKPVTVVLEAKSEFDRNVEFELDGAPQGMSVSGNRVSWTPKNRQTGTFRVAVRGSDGIAERTQELVVRVSEPERVIAKGRVDWALPMSANVFVDGRLLARDVTNLSTQLTEGRHTVRAEMLDGLATFEREIDVSGGKKTIVEPPALEYGKLSVYFLGGVGEFHLNGKKFTQQPPFTAAVLPTGRYAASCRMVREGDTRDFELVVRKGVDTVVEYEIGAQPVVSYE